MVSPQCSPTHAPHSSHTINFLCITYHIIVSVYHIVSPTHAPRSFPRQGIGCMHSCHCSLQHAIALIILLCSYSILYILPMAVRHSLHIQTPCHTQPSVSQSPHDQQSSQSLLQPAPVHSACGIQALLCARTPVSSLLSACMHPCVVPCTCLNIMLFMISKHQTLTHLKDSHW